MLELGAMAVRRTTSSTSSSDATHGIIGSWFYHRKGCLLRVGIFEIGLSYSREPCCRHRAYYSKQNWEAIDCLPKRITREAGNKRRGRYSCDATCAWYQNVISRTAGYYYRSVERSKRHRDNILTLVLTFISLPKVNQGRYSAPDAVNSKYQPLLFYYWFRVRK